MKKLTLYLLAGLVPILMTDAIAGSSTANLAVSATVISACTITTLPLAFGNYDPSSGNATNAQGSVVLVCTPGATPTVGLGTGLNPPSSGNTRQMTNGGLPTPTLLTYQLYQPSGNSPGVTCTYPPTNTTVWTNSGSGLFTPAVSSNILPQTYNVCGSIPASQAVVAGAYLDTVVATVNF